MNLSHLCDVRLTPKSASTLRPRLYTGATGPRRRPRTPPDLNFPSQQVGAKQLALRSRTPPRKKATSRPLPFLSRGPVAGLPGSHTGRRREEPGNPGGVAPTPSPGPGAGGGAGCPRNTLQMREALPAFLEGNARLGGGGAVRGIRPSPLPDVLHEQLPPANKVSSWLRRAAHPPATSASLAPAPTCFLGRAGGVPPTPSPAAVGEEPGPTPPLRR